MKTSLSLTAPFMLLAGCAWAQGGGDGGGGSHGYGTTHNQTAQNTVITQPYNNTGSDPNGTISGGVGNDQLGSGPDSDPLLRNIAMTSNFTAPAIQYHLHDWQFALR